MGDIDARNFIESKERRDFFQLYMIVLLRKAFHRLIIPSLNCRSTPEE